MTRHRFPAHDHRPRAVADARRRALLDRLRTGDKDAQEVAEGFDMSRPSRFQARRTSSAHGPIALAGRRRVHDADGMVPDRDPVGDRFGARVARILRYGPDRALHFQSRGRPEFTAMTTTPLRTWVEVELVPLSPDRMIVRLTHHGFGFGEHFDEGFKYLGYAWRIVPRRLEKMCASDGEPAKSHKTRHFSEEPPAANQACARSPTLVC